MRNRRRWFVYGAGALALVALAFTASQMLAPGPLREPGPAPAPDTAPAPAPPPLPPAAAPVGATDAPYELDNGVKVFRLTARAVMWETTPGDAKEAWTINGTVPGPTIRVRQGDRLRIVLENQLPEPTIVHWHGLILPANQDGIHINQPLIEPGQRTVFEFEATKAGTHWYHSHHNGARQTSSGVYGAFIIEPRDDGDPRASARYDREYIVMIGDVGLGLTINGRSFPYTDRLLLTGGETAVMRMVNTGVGNHPMHLHGHDFQIIAKDGRLRPAQPWYENVVDIAPGETYDLRIDGNNPGRWFFHCHILPHAEGPQGMFGLTQVLEYTDAPPAREGAHPPPPLPEGWQRRDRPQVDY